MSEAQKHLVWISACRAAMVTLGIALQSIPGGNAKKAVAKRKSIYAELVRAWSELDRHEAAAGEAA